MLLKTIILIFITTVKFSLQQDNYSDIIRLVKDLMITENKPTKVSAYLCWPKELRVLFWKSLSENSYFSKTGTVKEVFKRSVPEEHQMFLLDFSCNGSINIMRQAHQLNYFRKPLRWIIWGIRDISYFDDLHFGMDSTVYVVKKIGIEYKIITLYKPARNSIGFYENDVATWSGTQGFTHFNEFSVSINRLKLQGLNIRISFVVTNPDTHNHFWDYRDTHIDAITKLNWMLVHHVLSMVNATSTFIFQPTWGYKNTTTLLYSGMLGDLQSEHAVLGGSPCFFTSDRIDIVDFIAATTPTYMRFIFRAPPLTYVTNVFTLPFDSYVWYCSFVLMALIFLVVYLIVKWEWSDQVFEGTLQGMQHTLKPNIFDVFLMELGAITQQGSEAEPKSSAGRIATIFTFITLMFLYTSYSANIVALLQSTTESIRSLEDLLNSRMSLAVEDIVYAHYYFETAQEPIRKTIYQQKIAPKGQKANFMSVQEGISKVQAGFFAFHVELSTGYKVVAEIFKESEKCSLKEIAYVNIIEPWITVKKNSAYKEMFKISFERIHESGLQHREVNRIYTKKPICHSKGSNFGSVGLIDCYAAFLIFGIGVGCSLMIFVLEILFSKYQIRTNSVCVYQDECEDGSGARNINFIENEKETLDVKSVF